MIMMLTKLTLRENHEKNCRLISLNALHFKHTLKIITVFDVSHK